MFLIDLDPKLIDEWNIIVCASRHPPRPIGGTAALRLEGSEAQDSKKLNEKQNGEG